MPATMPNSTSIALFVKYSTPKPIAVVTLAKNKVTPIVSMVLAKAFILFLTSKTSGNFGTWWSSRYHQNTRKEIKIR